MLGKLNCNVISAYPTINVMPTTEKDAHWQAFGKWLRAQRRAADLTQDQVATRAGIHVLQVGRIEKGESGTKRETVLALANAIGADRDIALNKAGYAAVSPDHPLYGPGNIEIFDEVRKKLLKVPKNLAEFLEALESMGLEQFTFAADKEALENYGPEDFEELLERIKADVEITIRRKAR